jgi:hypothetical protein
MSDKLSPLANLRRRLQQGLVIPACPLALTAERKLDECRQRALARYYAAAGAGGLAVGVHTTQFPIHDSKVGLYRPVLELNAETLAAAGPQMVRVAGLVGGTEQASGEAVLAAELGYDCGLLSLAAFRGAEEEQILAHCRRVAEALPIVGFYLQPSVGGRLLSYRFWRRFAEIERVVAIKVAPFNRYQTIDVLRGVADAGRAGDIALYTGNDDHIVDDLITPFRFRENGPILRIVGGLLGHWSVWTSSAVRILQHCHQVAAAGTVPADVLTLGVQVTDSNAAFFDAANGFHGCIAGLHEVLRRQGLFAGTWCLDPEECLSLGQAEEIDRVYAAYPELNDDAFVAQHRDDWLA